jgi:membrane protease YdiL (CAAX protease family)
VKTGQATGLQIAFLMYAVMLLAVPLSGTIVREASLEGAGRTLVEKGTHFALAILLVGAIPALRSFAVRALATPIAPGARNEVVVVAVAKLAQAFAVPAALAIGFWATGEGARVEGMIVDVDREAASAFSGTGIVRLLLAVLVGPVVEELVFRGFLYRAFERQWGWIGSMLATSALFGLYHAYFWSAFVASIVLVCVVRRTGSLRAAIAVHMFFNLMLWWPLLGQHVFPHGVALNELSSWRFHGACLAFVAVALPIYVWMARDRHPPLAATVMLEPNGAVSK